MMDAGDIHDKAHEELWQKQQQEYHYIAKHAGIVRLLCNLVIAHDLG